MQQRKVSFLDSPRFEGVLSYWIHDHKVYVLEGILLQLAQRSVECGMNDLSRDPNLTIQTTTADLKQLMVNVTEKSDSISITVKDECDGKQERTFYNTFSKEKLRQMDLNQPLQLIASMINIAKKGSDPTLKFFIGYLKSGSKIKRDETNPKKIDLSQFGSSCNQNDSMIIVISIVLNLYSIGTKFSSKTTF